MPVHVNQKTVRGKVRSRLSIISSAMIDSSVVFLDSGIGGLPYLDWVVGKRPDIRVSYLADTKHFPYGEMSEDGVREAVLESASRLFDVFSPKILVLACNTASVTALDDVRAIAPCPVVGTVPAVKPAASIVSQGPIGVLATKGTVDSPYLGRLVQAFAHHRDVRRIAAGDIVRFVEERWLDEGDDGAETVMLRAVDELKSAGVGSVVIGCTHFLHVIHVIRKMMGEAVPLVDSRDGVGRRIISLYDELPECPSDDDDKSDDSFHVTQSGISDSRYTRFAQLHGLIWGGSIP